MELLKIRKQQLTAELAPETADNQARTVSLKWYTGATVPRGGFFTEPYDLTFSMDPAHVRMGRLSSGKAPLLNSHGSLSLDSILGVIEKADLQGNATVRFSNRPDVTPIWNDIKDGIIRNASMGAMVHKLKDVTPEDSKRKSYLAIDWEPMEVSLVPMGPIPTPACQPMKSSRRWRLLALPYRCPQPQTGLQPKRRILCLN